MPKKLNFYLLLLLFVIPTPGCDDNQDDYIPYVPVQLEIDLSVLNNLKVTANSMKFPEFGYGGVIVLCAFYDVSAPSQSVYYAYDATCTTEISRDCSLDPEGNGIIAVCPCCGSRFALDNGYKVQGDAPKPLKRYKTQLIGERLRVFN